MAVITRLMGEYDAEANSYSAFAGGGGSSPWTPDFNGRLIGLRMIFSREAATTKTNGVAFRLTCAAWTPNTIEVVGDGGGLQTAPALYPGSFDYKVDQPIISGTPVVMEGKCPGAETCVTNEVYLVGIFEVGARR